MGRDWTRKEFLKVAGTGVAGATLLGSSAAGAGCSYLPSGGARMNVIVVMLDSLRKDHVGAYGNDWIQTPNLDALSAESLRFTQAYPESIPTIPARRAIHTGLRTWPFRNWIPQKGETFFPAGWQRIPEDQTTLSETLKPEGYNTALVTDTQHMFKASMNFQRGFDIFDFIRGQERDRYRSPVQISEQQVDRFTVDGNNDSMRSKVRQYLANTADRQREEDWFSPQVFLRGMEYLEAARETQPFFLVVDNFDPHEPWDAPQKYIDLYSDGYDGSEPIVPNYEEAGWIGDRELERMRNLYAANVTLADRWFGNFMNKVEDLGLMGSTLIVALSDHGIALAEHDATGKPFFALWPELTDIPFFVRYPDGKGAGETNDYYASTHDVAPTILSALGIEQRQPMQGQDLGALLDDGGVQERNHFTLGYNDYVWTRDERYVMFSRNDGSSARLYDIQRDPEMNNDVAGGNPGIVKKMFREYVLEDAGGPLPRY